MQARSVPATALALLLSGGLSVLASTVALAAPVLVRDINPGPTGTPMSNFYATDTLVYFRASQPPFGSEVWRSDGTLAGTFMVEDLKTGFNESANPAVFSRLDNRVLFSAVDDSTTGLFITQGALNDIFRIKEDFVLWQDQTAALGDELLFGGSEIGPLGGDKELWKARRISDTVYDISRVADINAGPLASFPEALVTVGDRVYFRADGGGGAALWRSDGTASGTREVVTSPGKSSLRNPEELTDVAGRLFTAAVSDEHGAEPWVVESGTPRVIDICPGICSAGAGGIAAVGSLAYFRSLGNVTRDGTTGAELWRSDGTEAGTWKVREIGPGSRPAYISTITDFNGKAFYFLADDGTHGLELWRSNGTANGTYMVKDINPGAASGVSNVHTEIHVVGHLVFFAADDGRNGFELWRSDGTEPGTFMVRNLNRAGNAYPANFALIDDRLIFTATDLDHGTEIWALESPLVIPPATFKDGFEPIVIGPIR